MTPEASIYFRWGTQSRRIYDFLALCGPKTGDQIFRRTRIIGYPKKIAEIRARLAGTGVTVKARPINGRKKPWEYRLATEDAGDKAAAK